MGKQKNDMLHGSIWRGLPRFALPIAATAILGQLFNASDIAVVGNFAAQNRTAAVAAVGANSPIVSLIVNLFIGISLGSNVVIANAIGRRAENAIEKTVHTSIVIAVLGGVLVRFWESFARAGCCARSMCRRTSLTRRFIICGFICSACL